MGVDSISCLLQGNNGIAIINMAQGTQWGGVLKKSTFNFPQLVCPGCLAFLKRERKKKRERENVNVIFLSSVEV